MINRISHSHLIFSPNSFTNKFNNICAFILDPLYSVGRVYGIVKIRMVRCAEVVSDSVFLFCFDENYDYLKKSKLENS